MKKTAATLALAGTLLLTGAATATAGEYPANPAQCGVGAGSVGVGGSVDFGCGGLTPEETVTVTITCSPANDGTAIVTRTTVVADGSGSITYSTVADTAGVCEFAAVGATSGAAGAATVTVTGAVTAQSGTGGSGSASTGAAGTGTAEAGLAATGADASLAIWGAAGAGALALGAVAITISQRRRNADAA